MSAHILNGKAIAEAILRDIQNRIRDYQLLGYRVPGLAVVLIGSDPASEIYVRNKYLMSQKVGMHSRSLRFDTSISENDLLKLIDELNNDETIDGILVQLPLPSHIQSQAVIEKIDPSKDVDGFHPYNLGRLAQKKPLLRPCTPAGIMQLLKSTGISLAGLNATVIGVSNIVGKPMILELLMAGCTVTACNRQTQNLKQCVSNADLLVVATGSPGLVKGSWIKPNAIVIDVGMNRLDNGHLVGDVEFEEAKKRAGWITPVPGGVGPMTVATLLQNTLYAYSKKFLRED